MAYNYGAPAANGYNGGQQPMFGQVPGMPVPQVPGFLPPGTDNAAGMMPSHPPNGIPGQFQAPPNMPNINFNAPVIRLGLGDQRSNSGNDRGMGGAQGYGDNRRYANDGGGPRGRPGLGADRGDRNLDRERAAVRESMMALQPPTREEVARTIFIGGLCEGVPDDETIENILRCAGKLRRWVRARDAQDKKCKFGFAEYEDVDSLEAANEIFVDVQVPLIKDGSVSRDDDGTVKQTKLLVVVDEQSKTYIEDWKGKRREEENARQFRIDGCKEDLKQILTGLLSAGSASTNGKGEGFGTDGNGQAINGVNGDASHGENAEVVTIPLSLEDELADIPADMRATVAEEIKAFRDRSVRRDLERVRREEEDEKAERQKSVINRLSSPAPATAPSGPSSTAVNGIPVGPRGSAQVPPSGPRGHRGVQMPSDYANGVTFVSDSLLNFDDETSDEPDVETERKRLEQHKTRRAKQFEDALHRWTGREQTRANAQKRERLREEAEKHKVEKEKQSMSELYSKWDDEAESRSGRELYYRDPGAWLRDRAARLDQEAKADDRDRAAEEREKAGDNRRQADARGLADSFLEQTASEMTSSTAPTRPQQGLGGFKISLGSAAAKSRAAAEAAPSRRKIHADVEGLLEDEEDAAASGLSRPSLKPLTDLSTAATGQDMSDEERSAAKKQLVAEIPTAVEDLFQHPVQWGYLSRDILQTQIRPFVEKKVVEYLGVQEDLLVDVIMDAFEVRKEATKLVSELEDALGDEAELLVKKVWRLVIYWTESEARGLV